MTTNLQNAQPNAHKIPVECMCAICRNNKDFIFPKQLLEEVKKRNVVIFAGAGISTESRTVFPSTFYENIAAERSDCSVLPGFSTDLRTGSQRPGGSSHEHTRQKGFPRALGYLASRLRVL